jgi:outer membrane protein assembly factor BamB
MQLANTTKPLILVLSLGSAMMALGATQADYQKNWPHWRGPLANGVAPLGDPPTEWSETKNVKWKVSIPGVGNSTPVIWGDKLFVLTVVNTGKRPEGAASTAVGAQPAPPAENAQPPDGGRRGGGGGQGGGSPPTETHQFVVLCLDRNTGKILWQKTAREEVPHQQTHNTSTHAPASPITDGQQLYVSFGSRGIYCYDLDGNLKWQRDLGKMQTINNFGEGGSPALHGDKLIVNWDHEGPDFITALNTKTGETIWKTERDERRTWVTPAIIPTTTKTQVVVPGTGKTRSYDLATGELIWECAGLANGNVVPAPVFGHGYVFAMNGQGGNSFQAIRYDRTGDLTGTDAVGWSLQRNAPHVPSSLLYDDLIYFFSSNNGIISCYEAATGKPFLDAHRIEAFQQKQVYASPVGAAGRIYLLARDGTAVVLKKGPQFESLASNKLDDGFDASPVIVGKELFLRGRQNLYCIAAN